VKPAHMSTLGSSDLVELFTLFLMRTSMSDTPAASRSTTAVFAPQKVAMGKRPDVPPETRGLILGMHQCQRSVKEIATAVSLGLSTVYRVIAKHENSAPESQRQNCGMKKIFGSRYAHRIHRAVTVNPFMSAREVRMFIEDGKLRLPSRRTISRVLQTTLRMPARRPAKKPRLTAQQRQTRLEFCERYEGWTADDWERVLFSDESMIQQFRCFHQYVRRPAGQRFNIRYTKTTVKHCDSVMIWGAFGARGVGDLFFIPSGVVMDSGLYTEVMNSCLETSMAKAQCTVFQQDGAPCHKAASVRSYFEEHHIDVLEWPGNSPDLNPIENLWHIVKMEVAKMHPTSWFALLDAILEVWRTKITAEMCRELARSMPERIRAVIAARGGCTRF
jgi:hypothetical protein